MREFLLSLWLAGQVYRPRGLTHPIIARLCRTGNRPRLRLAIPDPFFRFLPSGAHDRTRTGDPVLTKNVLYLLSYVGNWWRGQDSNLRSPSQGAGFTAR